MTETEIIETQIEIFNRILASGESNKLRAAEAIRKLDARARRDLRATLQELDYLLDDIFLEERREARRRK
jgi:hypothetical protein